jgi:FMN-dependent NADH-azoreductase
MKTLLVINCSGRVTRSITRRLTDRFVARWRNQNPEGTVVQRDVGQNPPSPINESWIAAAFAEPAKHTPAMRDALQLSESFIEEIVAADTIVIGTPIYNFGMPAQLKAYFDQIVRVGRTFSFSAEASDPYRPLLASKPVIVVTAAGDGSLFPGGALAHLNFLEPHLATLLGFVGLTDVTFVRVGYEEFQDDRLKTSLAAAESSIDEIAAGQFAACALVS